MQHTYIHVGCFNENTPKKTHTHHWYEEAPPLLDSTAPGLPCPRGDEEDDDEGSCWCWLLRFCCCFSLSTYAPKPSSVSNKGRLCVSYGSMYDPNEASSDTTP